MNQIMCQLHPKSPVLQACTDISCPAYPFLCRLCLQDHFQLSLHQTHGQSIKGYSEFIEYISKQLHQQQSVICKTYKDIFIKAENLNILKWITDSSDHLSNLESFIRSQKFLIQTDIAQIVEELTFNLSTIQQQMFDRLDYFYSSYKSNLLFLKEIAEPVNMILTKFKYYANPNNLKVINYNELFEKQFKIMSENLRTQSQQMMKIKSCLNITQQLENVDKSRSQHESIIKCFKELNKALDLLPSYNNERIGLFFQNQIQGIQQYFDANLVIPDLQIYGPFLQKPLQVIPDDINEKPTPSIQTEWKDEPKPDIKIDNELVDESAVIENDEIQSQKPKPSISLPTFESITKAQLIPRDCRILENMNIQQIITKPASGCFKIKKVLTLDFTINCFTMITPQLAALGLNDGSLKLLDLVSNKVSFYTHAFITHTKEIISMINLANSNSKSQQSIRLASSSIDCNIIIWSLGENNVAYPERKLTGFDKPIIRMLDLEDGAHLVGCDEFGRIYIINYHDNRIPFKDQVSNGIIEIIYINKFERFITFSSNNQINVYNVKFNSLLTNMVLKNCELLIQVQGVNLGMITTCLIIENIICYGTKDGKIKLMTIEKNELIYETQLFKNGGIIELFAIKSTNGSIIGAIGENDVKIKILTKMNDRILLQEQFGEMKEFPTSNQWKYCLQILNKGKATLMMIHKSQKGITLLELA